MLNIDVLLHEGLKIPADRIGLETSGGLIEKVEFVKDEDTGGRTNDFYRVTGVIHPKDPEGFDITFQAGFPLKWNRRLLQFGGGGLDGFVSPVEYLCLGTSFGAPSSLSKGYVVFSSDSGHKAPEDNYWDCRWGLNDEALENYAHAALKKLKDAMVYLVEHCYKSSPELVYFAGGSNGGRECMKAIQLYPEDYDGAICLYPALYFISKVLMDHRNANFLEVLGEDAWISAEKQNELSKILLNHCDALDGVNDGLISNLSAATVKKEEILEAFQRVLNPKQLKLVGKFMEPLSLSFPLGYGEVTLPGYALLEGAPLIDKHTNLIGSSASARDGAAAVGADNIISSLIMRDADYDLRNFEPSQHQEKLQQASKLLDAYEPNLDGFRKRGGKLILLHGTTDSLISVHGTIQYYNELVNVYGKDKVDNFLKFYVVPGYGHGMGEMFLMDVDLVKALDDWVTFDTEPKDLVATDQNDMINFRTRPLYEFPNYPAYSGDGNPNEAKSFIPKSINNF